jgi:DNA-directed RNA polymerase sigma subunit (sigma70/sigma32)
MDSNLKETLMRCLDILDARERAIITLRFGLILERVELWGKLATVQISN